MTLRPLALCALLLSTAAMGASAVDAQRATVKQERAALEAQRARSAALKAELDAVGARIEQQKAQGGLGVLGGGALDADLRQSQQLSGALAELTSAIASAEGNLAREEEALATALTAEIKATQEAALRASGEGRRALIARLRALRSERATVRPRLPAANLPSAAEESEDPEELLEQADALRDAEDKARQRLRAVQGRLREAKEERALDERMSDFFGDESLFDEQDRRLRLLRDGDTLRVAPGESVELFTAREAAPGAGAEVIADPTAPGAPPPGGISAPTSSPLPVGEAAKPHLGARAAPLSPAEELEQLEAEQRRLESTARELSTRAAALEERARKLE